MTVPFINLGFWMDLKDARVEPARGLLIGDIKPPPTFGARLDLHEDDGWIRADVTGGFEDGPAQTVVTVAESLISRFAFSVVEASLSTALDDQLASILDQAIDAPGFERRLAVQDTALAIASLDRRTDLLNGMIANLKDRDDELSRGLVAAWSQQVAFIDVQRRELQENLDLVLPLYDSLAELDTLSVPGADTAVGRHAGKLHRSLPGRTMTRTVAPGPASADLLNTPLAEAGSIKQSASLYRSADAAEKSVIPPMVDQEALKGPLALMGETGDGIRSSGKGGIPVTHRLYVRGTSGLHDIRPIMRWKDEDPLPAGTFGYEFLDDGAVLYLTHQDGVEAYVADSGKILVFHRCASPGATPARVWTRLSAERSTADHTVPPDVIRALQDQGWVCRQPSAGWLAKKSRQAPGWFNSGQPNLDPTSPFVLILGPDNRVIKQGQTVLPEYRLYCNRNDRLMNRTVRQAFLDYGLWPPHSMELMRAGDGVVLTAAGRKLDLSSPGQPRALFNSQTLNEATAA